MANSTWLQATNEILALATLDQIADATTFDNEDQGNLEKYQAAAKQFVKLANKYLGIRAYNHFASRRCELDIAEGESVYPIDTGLDPENIKFETFRNVTRTSPQSNNNGRVEYWPYKKFQDYYPIEDQITTGPPLAWTLLPIERTEQSPKHMVRVIPNPDDNYKLEYVAKLHAPELTTSESLILFPKHSEHALWIMAWELTEVALGEGKEGRLAQLAERAANQVFLAAGKLPDERKVPRTMKMGGSQRGRRRWYSSPPSVDANGTVID